MLLSFSTMEIDSEFSKGFFLKPLLDLYRPCLDLKRAGLFYKFLVDEKVEEYRTTLLKLNLRAYVKRVAVIAAFFGERPS